jgi:hypothetical protein
MKVTDMSELSEKGNQIYESKILPQLPVDKLKGKIIAIDVQSEEYFIEERRQKFRSAKLLPTLRF